MGTKVKLLAASALSLAGSVSAFAQESTVTISDMGITEYVDASQTNIQAVLTAVLPIAFGILVTLICFRLYKRFVR